MFNNFHNISQDFRLKNKWKALANLEATLKVSII